MNIYSKKRKSTFNTYKAIRANILLNHSNHSQVSASIVNLNNLLENNWVEQYSELMTEHMVFNQKLSKTNKIVVKWWEN